MIKAQDFYNALKSHSDAFKAHELKKVNRTSFMFPDNIKLQFLLDRWGWDDENGWSFCARLFDMKQQDKWGNVLGFGASIDIHPIDLVKEKLLDEAAFLEIYDRHTNLRQKAVSSSWFLFYDEEELENLLALVLPEILIYAKEWSPNDGR